jgi:hypothetical protein
MTNETLCQVEISAILALALVIFGPPGFSSRREGGYIMITGEASPHITYDHCFVEYLKQISLTNYQWIKLADIDIKGNAHFMFMEKTNQVIAAAINAGLKEINQSPAAPGHPALPISIK